MICNCKFNQKAVVWPYPTHLIVQPQSGTKPEIIVLQKSVWWHRLIEMELFKNLRKSELNSDTFPLFSVTFGSGTAINSLPPKSNISRYFEQSSGKSRYLATLLDHISTKHIFILAWLPRSKLKMFVFKFLPLHLD